MPAAAFIESVCAAAAETVRQQGAAADTPGAPRPPILIENLTIHEPLLLGETSFHRLQTGFTFKDDTANFQIISQPLDKNSADGWQVHVSGKLKLVATENLPSVTPAAQGVLVSDTDVYPQTLAPERFYDQLASAGIAFGPSFQGIETLRYDQTNALGRIRMTDQVAAEMLKGFRKTVSWP